MTVKDTSTFTMPEIKDRTRNEPTVKEYNFSKAVQTHIDHRGFLMSGKPA
jgi:hypothetical protein